MRKDEVSSEAERWIQGCQSDFLQTEKETIRKSGNCIRNPVACLHFLPLSLPFQGERKNKEGKAKKRKLKSKCDHARKMQGLVLELISFWGKEISSEGNRESVKHNTKKALKIIAWMEKEPPGTVLSNTFYLSEWAAREGKWIVQSCTVNQ